jgi:POT family proton-dependent oligopeptide transporter
MQTVTTGSTPNNGMFSHPRGLSTLFFTEMWERFSYYGMRSILVLFMTAAVMEGGLGFDDPTATAIYGLYTAGVYIAAMPGGWIADRLTGAQRAVLYGGIVIALGHFTLAIPALETFYLGLILVVVGTGLLKPNVSAIVGELYLNDPARRDAGYTIFYLGINVGAMLGPLVCGLLATAAGFGWHWGFAAAGVGMVLGLVQYRLTWHYLGDAGLLPGQRAANPSRAWMLVAAGSVLLAAVTALGLSGMVSIDALTLARTSAWIIAAIAAAFFAAIYIGGKLDAGERRRIAVIGVLFIASAVFWSGFEQAGSSLNLFGQRYTDRLFMGFEIPAAWFQSLNPLFILIFAPFFAALWVNLGRRNLDPGIPAKFALGLIQLGLGFLVMYGASRLVAGGDSVLPTWLVLTYLLHTTGELCLSPVGLSAVSTLAPKRYLGQLMGVWFLGMSLGNLMAGLLAGRFDPESLHDMPGLYLQIVMMTVGTGIVLLLFSKRIRRLID